MAWFRNIARGMVLAALVTSGAGYIARAQGLNVPPPAPDGLKVTQRAYDMAKVGAESTLPDNLYRGRVIWMQRCAYCHDGVGQPSYDTMGPFLEPDLVTALGDAGLAQFITQGTDRMPGFQYTLSAAQIAELIAYVKTIPASAKPTELQMAGKLPSEGKPKAGTAPATNAPGGID